MNNSKVPQIRFKGFSEDWEQRKLSDITDKVTEKNAGLQFIETFTNSAEFGIISQRDFFDHDISKIESLDGYYIVREEDFVYNPRISTTAPVGPINRNKLGKIGVMSPLYTVFRTHNVDNTYLEHFYKSRYWHSFMNFNGDTGARSDRFSIKDNLFFMMPIPAPKIEEQKKIGNFLTNVNNFITLHQCKYDKLVNIKKALLERMFPQAGETAPAIRFKGFTDAWEQRKFGECVLVQRGGSPRPIENYITKACDGINWIKIGDVAVGSRYITSTEEKIIPEGEKKSRRVFIGDLILSNSMSFGRPYIMQVNGCIHDGWLLIRDEIKIFNTEYLLQLLSSDYMLLQYKSLASGGVVNNLNSELVKSTMALIPSKDEQEQLGKFFKNLDNIITLHQRKLEKLKNIKSALLEKMFVS